MLSRGKVWKIWQMNTISPTKTIQTSHAHYKAIGLYTNLPNFLPNHLSNQFCQTFLLYSSSRGNCVQHPLHCSTNSEFLITYLHYVYFMIHALFH